MLERSTVHDSTTPRIDSNTHEVLPVSSISGNTFNQVLRCRARHHVARDKIDFGDEIGLGGDQPKVRPYFRARARR